MRAWQWVLLAVLAALAGYAYVNRAGFLPASKLRTSSAGRAEIKRSEGTELRAYQDVAGYWTIGTGHLVTKAEMPKYVGTPTMVGGKLRGSIVITAAQADEILTRDLATAEAAVARYVIVPVSQGMFDALVSFVFNLGAGNLSASTLLKKLNAQDYIGAAAEFLNWNKAGGKEVAGLTERRQREKSLFLQGVA